MTRENLFSGQWDGDDEAGTRHRVFWRPDGARMGATLYELAPGAPESRIHMHFGAEEMFFILEGEGSVRIAGEIHRIRTGDFISLPPGRDSAHQIFNDSNAPLRYLAVSTMEIPEVLEYPDSGKLGALAGTPGARPPTADSVRHFARLKDGVDYWEGED